MKLTLIVFPLFLCTATLAAREPAAPKQDAAIHVVTYLDLLPDRADSSRLLLIHEVQAQGEQPGCLSVELLQEQGRANHFMVVEAWRDTAALDGWHASNDYLQFRTSLQPALGSPLDERRFHRLVP